MNNRLPTNSLTARLLFTLVLVILCLLACFVLVCSFWFSFCILFVYLGLWALTHAI